MTEMVDRRVIEAARQRYKAHTAAKERVMLQALAAGDKKAMNRLDELSRYVNRFVQMGRPQYAAELLSEFTEGRDSRVSALERIIEQNELMAASFFARGLAASRTVGRIVVRNAALQTRGYGTGFMISPKLMMTNNHVLDGERSAELSLIEFDHALGADGQPMLPKRFSLSPSIFWETSIPLDFSIVGVEPVNEDGLPVESRGWIHLIAESGKAIAGEPINIIQHPGGERQQVAMRENRIIGPDGDFLIYTTDTKRGSSGSPAMNDQWQLAALHHAGVPDEDDQGNWLRKDGGIYRPGIDDPETIKWIGNEGVRISRIVSTLSAKAMDTSKRAIFEEAFTPAPIPNEANSVLPPSQWNSGSGRSPGGSIGSDGVARWNFQLSFGPTGQGGSVAPPTRPSGPIPPIAAVPTLPPTPTVGDLESVFEPRGDYFDADAEVPLVDAYYAGIDDSLSKADLFNALQALVSDTHHTKLSYSNARHGHLYPWIDRHEDETLKSIYSGDKMAEELFVAELKAFEAAVEREAELRETSVAALSQERIEAVELALENSSVFNCEHVVPQSWFKGAAEQRAQKTDMHHLFSCDSRCNSFRSNIPYADFTEEEEAILRASEISAAEALADPTLEAVRASCGLREGRRFEPDAGKGASARATLYFVLRYPGVVGDVKSGKNKEFVKSNVGMLLDWAEAEPPARYEQHRNAEIAKVQGNRNPLIDHPEWLREIDFGRGFG